MTDASPLQIRRNRELLLNPYAFVGGDGEFEGVLPVVAPDSPASASPDQIRRAREQLLNQYAFHSDGGEYEASLPAANSGSTNLTNSRIDADLLLGRKRRGNRFSRPEIEDVARKLQIALWLGLSKSEDAQTDPLSVVDPVWALERLGLQLIEDPCLEDIVENGEVLGAAGVLDRDNSIVRYSPRFPLEMKRFTLAHELGHVMLHPGSGLHRDRGLDGSRSNRRRLPEESEADQFAAAFLMPAKQLRGEFLSRFHTCDFVLDERTENGLASGVTVLSRPRRWSRSDLARRLAGATFYGGVHFDSLVKRFQVSEGAMAIRLKELGLVRG